MKGLLFCFLIVAVALSVSTYELSLPSEITEGAGEIVYRIYDTSRARLVWMESHRDIEGARSVRPGSIVLLPRFGDGDYYLEIIIDGEPYGDRIPFSSRGELDRILGSGIPDDEGEILDAMAIGLTIQGPDGTENTRIMGNVGIGTPAGVDPSAQLHTTGTVRFAGAGTPAAGRVLTATNASGDATWQNIDPDGHVHATLTRGNGLTGSNYNGSVGTTWAVNFGTTAGTVAEGNHNHSGVYSEVGHSHANHTAGVGLTGTAYNGSVAREWTVNFGTGFNEVARGNHSHATLTRGTGLTGSNYDGSAGTTWAVNFGTTAGTVAEGNHTHSDMVTGSGTINKVAFWNPANVLTSNTNFHWDNTNERLGIGTATPGHRLHSVVADWTQNAIYGENTDWNVVGALGYGASLPGHPSGWSGAAVMGHAAGGFVDAVYGYAPSGGCGVIGRADDEDFYGVYGHHGGNGTGVLGYSQSTGVYGYGTSTLGSIGVFGTSAATDGLGVVGFGGSLTSYTVSGNGDGIVGAADGGYGVVASNYTGATRNSWAALGTQTFAGYFVSEGTTAMDVVYATRASANHGAGRSTIYGYRPGASGAASGGSGWGVNDVDTGLKGYSYWGNAYSAGVAAYSYLDYDNSAALVAARNTGYPRTLLATRLEDSDGFPRMFAADMYGSFRNQGFSGTRATASWSFAWTTITSTTILTHGTGPDSSQVILNSFVSCRPISGVSGFFYFRLVRNPGAADETVVGTALGETMESTWDELMTMNISINAWDEPPSGSHTYALQVYGPRALDYYGYNINVIELKL